MTNPDALLFPIKQSLGSAVHHIVQSNAGEFEGEVVTKLEDLKPGMRVVAWNSIAITVQEIDGAKGTGISNAAMVFLEHGTDDRNCWVAIGMANLRGITKMEMSSSEQEDTSAPEFSPSAPKQ